MTSGRFAPSPSGSLHLGNLRTALLAWCATASVGGRFIVRMEDLTTAAATHPRVAAIEAEQLAELDLLELRSDVPVVRQSERTELYDMAVRELEERRLTYPCFCTRREIREAAVAPHDDPSPEGAYPGTCRALSAAEREERIAAGRRPALRLRAEGAVVTVRDARLGELTAPVDDFVLRRGDGVAAYNLAVVVDDADQGIDQVVRGDDLWPVTPRQVLLQRLLGLPRPAYLHVPLVVGPDGRRLAKRHGAVTLAERLAAGDEPARVRGLLWESLGWAGPGERLSIQDLLDRFDRDSLPVGPSTWCPTGTVEGFGDPGSDVTP